MNLLNFSHFNILNILNIYQPMYKSAKIKIIYKI